MEALRLSLDCDPSVAKEVADILISNGVTVDSAASPIYLTCSITVSGSRQYDTLENLLSKVNDCKIPLESVLTTLPSFKLSDQHQPLLFSLRRLGLLKSVTPLHSARGTLKELVREVGWLGLSRERREERLTWLSNYIGPQQAVYFRFLNGYTSWLFFPAAVSIIFAIFQPFDHVYLLPMTLLWSTLFLQFFWQPLISGIGKFPKSRLTASADIAGRILSYTCFILFFALVVSLHILSMHIRLPLIDGRSSDSTMHVIARTVLGLSFGPVSRKLVSWEGRVREEDYLRSWYVKVIFLRVFSFYAYPVFLAMTADEPFQAIESFLAQTFTLSVVISTVTEMLPTVLTRLTTRNTPQAWEGQEWDVNEEYLEMATQFANLMAFGFVYPLSFAFAFLNNVLEGHFDLEKLYLARRPLPLAVNVSRLWLRVFQASTVLGVFINLVILSRTSAVGETQSMIFTLLLMRAVSAMITTYND